MAAPNARRVFWQEPPLFSVDFVGGGWRPPQKSPPAAILDCQLTSGATSSQSSCVFVHSWTQKTLKSV